MLWNDLYKFKLCKLKLLQFTMRLGTRSRIIIYCFLLICGFSCLIDSKPSKNLYSRHWFSISPSNMNGFSIKRNSFKSINKTQLARKYFSQDLARFRRSTWASVSNVSKCSCLKLQEKSIIIGQIYNLKRVFPITFEKSEIVHDPLRGQQKMW